MSTAQGGGQYLPPPPSLFATGSGGISLLLFIIMVSFQTSNCKKLQKNVVAYIESVKVRLSMIIKKLVKKMSTARGGGAIPLPPPSSLYATGSILSASYYS